LLPAKHNKIYQLQLLRKSLRMMSATTVVSTGMIFNLGYPKIEMTPKLASFLGISRADTVGFVS
jgi:hypothetical protein